MKIIKSLSELKKNLVKKENIFLIPTMGNLHEGHLSLIKEAKKLSKNIVLTIFINPIQFNSENDLNSYPRTLSQDINLLNGKGISVLFIPSVKDIYPKKPKLSYKMPLISNQLCGESRKGHFKGVITIIDKLFNLIMPSYAIFGKKDYQQLLLISDFVKENNIPINIIGSEIVRDKRGLALSSRNNHLSNDEKKLASNLHKSLEIIANKGDKLTNNDIIHEKNRLLELGFGIDYLNVCNPQELSEESNYTTRPLVIAIAAYIREIRLIDNILIT